VVRLDAHTAPGLQAENTTTDSGNLTVSTTDPGARVLSHEQGHVEQAQEMGWRYLPLYVGEFLFVEPAAFIGLRMAGVPASPHNAHPMEHDAELRRGLGDMWRASYYEPTQ
jgi:hypothetical protein